MYVREVRLQGIKSFTAPHRVVRLSLERPDGTYSGWTVVAGRNGAGKSSFLQAIALALSGPSVARSLRPTFEGWITEGYYEGRVAVKLAYAPEQDRFVGGGFPPGVFWAGLRWLREQDDDLISTKPAEPVVDQYVPDGPKRSSIRGPWADNPRGWFMAGYGPFRRLSKASSEAQRLMLGTTRHIQLATLFREDASLEECVQWLQQINFQKLEKKAGAAELEENVLAILNDGLLPEGVRIERVDSQGLWVSGPDVTNVLLDEMSDGYRTVAALVADLLRLIYTTYGELRVVPNDDGRMIVPHEGVILIDEIDVHLHVTWQKRIGFWLKEHFPNVQFIVSTHSPFICQAADPGGLIRLPAPGEQRGATRIEGDLFFQIVNGGADEAILSDLFGLEYTHSEHSEDIRRRVAELETRVITGAASPGDEQELDELARELPEPEPDVLGRLFASDR